MDGRQMQRQSVPRKVTQKLIAVQPSLIRAFLYSVHEFYIFLILPCISLHITFPAPIRTVAGLLCTIYACFLNPVSETVLLPCHQPHLSNPKAFHTTHYPYQPDNHTYLFSGLTYTRHGHMVDPAASHQASKVRRGKKEKANGVGIKSSLRGYYSRPLLPASS